MSLSRLIDLHNLLREPYPTVTGVIRPISGTPYATFDPEPSPELRAQVQAVIDAFDWAEEVPATTAEIQAAIGELTATDKAALFDVLMGQLLLENPKLLDAIGKKPKKARL